MIERSDFDAMVRRRRWQTLARQHDPRRHDPLPRARARQAVMAERLALQRMIEAPHFVERRIDTNTVVRERTDFGG